MTIYLSHIYDKEIYQNIFDALMAEIDGKFGEWRYRSKDYLETMDEIIGIEAEKLPEEERTTFSRLLENAEGNTLYEKLMKIKGYNELKDKIRRIRSWEKTSRYSIQDGQGERHVEFTDDFYTLFNIGNYKGSNACQSCTFNSDLNRGLTGYVVTGKY